MLFDSFIPHAPEGNPASGRHTYASRVEPKKIPSKSMPGWAALGGWAGKETWIIWFSLGHKYERGPVVRALQQLDSN